jgi:hypothetical protein
VRSGIEAGERVCTTTLAVMVDGMRVEVADVQDDWKTAAATDGSS